MRVIDDRLEHWLNIRRRARDHLEDLAGRCQVAIACFQFVAQPHVFNRNDRLVGEGLEERDLVVGECPGSARPTAMTPTGLPSRIMGTMRLLRKPTARLNSVRAYSGSSSTSGMWTTARSRIARPDPVAPLGGAGQVRRAASHAAGVQLWAATTSSNSPSKVPSTL